MGVLFVQSTSEPDAHSLICLGDAALLILKEIAHWQFQDMPNAACFFCRQGQISKAIDQAFPAISYEDGTEI
jgi:hypothetical protein